MKNIIFCIFILLLISCNSSNEIPKDFAIKIKFGHQVYNSKTELLTRQMLRTKDKSVKLAFTTKQKVKLYDYYKEMDFLKFPSEFECDTLKPGGNIPCSDIELEITANGIIKSSRTSDYCIQKTEMEKEKKLYEISRMIIKIIEENPAYKKLPDTDYLSL